MNESSLQNQIDAARAYETLFVPALFGQWAPKVADAARTQPGHRALDVGADTGILARAIAARVGSTGHVAGVDPSAGMLAVAGQLAPAVEWREGVGESLPFADRSFDAVVSQFALMFFDDRPQALREMLRVLTPGGRMAVAVWDSLESMPAYASEVALLERMAGRHAADALRAPFVLGNRTILAALFSEAGVGEFDITTHEGTAQFPGIRTMVEADLRGWLPVMGITLTEDVIERTLQDAEQSFGSYAAADGRVAFHLSAHIAIAAKPRHVAPCAA